MHILIPPPPKLYCTFNVVTLPWVFIYFVPTLKKWKIEWMTLIIKSWVEVRLYQESDTLQTWVKVTRKLLAFPNSPNAAECQIYSVCPFLYMHMYVFIKTRPWSLSKNECAMVPCYLEDVCLKIFFLSHYFTPFVHQKFWYFFKRPQIQLQVLSWFSSFSKAQIFTHLLFILTIGRWLLDYFICQSGIHHPEKKCWHFDVNSLIWR